MSLHVRNPYSEIEDVLIEQERGIFQLLELEKLPFFSEKNFINSPRKAIFILVYISVIEKYINGTIANENNNKMRKNKVEKYGFGYRRDFLSEKRAGESWQSVHFYLFRKKLI